MHFERFQSALFETASVLLVADGQAVLVDPGITSAEVAAIRDRVEGLGARVTHVLATHADWDHVCGIAAFPEAAATMGEATADRVRASGAADLERSAGQAGITVAGPPRVDLVLRVGVAHRLGPFTVETMALPGHTPGGVAYRVRALDLLMVGDHLSRIEFPFVSSPAAYRATLAGLIDLLRHDPPALVVPGHGPALRAAEALEVAVADLTYLRALHAAVLGAGGDRERARAAALAVEPPRMTAELAAARDANVDGQLAEVLPD